MGRKRNCDHPLTEENTSRRRNGHSDGCLTCKTEKDKATFQKADKQERNRRARERYAARKQEMKRSGNEHGD